MKPTLHTSLLALVLAAAAHADYSGGQITNQNNTYTGDINITYSIDDDQRHGAVEITGAEAQDTTTVLEGNITIEAGKGLENTIEERKNYGILIAKDPADTEYAQPDPGYNATVILKTTGADDRITIDTYGNKSAGVWNLKQDTKVILDASSSNHAIEINLHHTGDTDSHGRGLATDHGQIEVLGSINITTAGSNAFGIYNYLGSVSVSGTTTITNNGPETVAVRNGGGTVTLNDVNINSVGNAVYTYRSTNHLQEFVGGNTVINGNLNVNGLQDASSDIFNRGVYVLAESSVEVFGTTTVNVTGSRTDGLRTDGGTLTVRDATVTSGRNGILSAAGGTFTVKGNADITTLKNDTTNSYGIFTQTAGTLVIEGTANVKTDTSAATNTGIRATTASVATILGKTTVLSGGDGIVAATGASVTLASPADVTSALGHAVNSSGQQDGTYSKVTLNGATKLTAGAGKYSLWASSGGIIEGKAAQYTFSGNIGTNAAGSTIDLSLAGKSNITGATSFNGSDLDTQVINLSLADSSVWNVTGNSQLTNLTLGQGSALQLTFSGASLTDIISATDTITLEAGSVIYLTGDLSNLQGGTFDFFSGTVDNQGVQFVGFDGTDWVEYEYTNTPGTNTFAFSASAPTVIEEPGFIPEPATATLGLLGLASLLARRRRA